jgi:hypothetical protein
MQRLLSMEQRLMRSDPVNSGLLAFEVAGKMVFSPLVHHPGTRANPFMQRALNQTLDKVDSVFADLWLELVRWLKWGFTPIIKPSLTQLKQL